MTNENARNSNSCPRTEIAVYIDGELDLRDELELELHFVNCPECAAELNAQKSFLAALNSAKIEEKIPLPPDFMKTVVANAESCVSGLRRPRERFNALLICSALFLLVILGLGSEMSGVLDSSGNFFEQITAVGGLFLRFVYDVALGTAVVLRSLCSQFVFKSEAANGLLLILFAISAFMFVRLMVRCKQI